MERRIFQGVVVLPSLIPLAGLAIDMTSGGAFFLPDGDDVSVNLDNQLRCLSGVYASVTLAIWWTLPELEERLAPIRIACAGAFIGGLGRLASMAAYGSPPDASMVAGVVLEVGILPLLMLWQARLAAARAAFDVERAHRPY